MSNSPMLILIFLALLYFPQNLLIFTRADVAQSKDLITKTCTQTKYKNLCLFALDSCKTSTNLTLTKLETILLENILSLVQQTSQRLAGLMNHVKNPTALKGCAENFNDAVEQLKNSADALPNKKYNDMNTWITAAMTDVQTCEDSLKPHSPITVQNNNIQQLCSVALSITDQLGGSEDDVSKSEDAAAKQGRP